MASWIVFIHADHPEHWGVALGAGFWDMTSHHKIELGDTVYFWQAGGSLVAQTTATTSAYPITSSDRQPWDDTGTRTYKARFEFDCLSESPTGQPTWQNLRDQWGYNYYPRLRPFTDAAEEKVIAQYFATQPVRDPYRDAERDAELKRLGFDNRTFAMRSIAQRQGQQAFRNRLLGAYGAQCAVTGTSAVSVLEAAHIARFLGPQSNRTNNGLLLRADIHTLFDLHQLTVTPDYVVRVDPGLEDTYDTIDGADLHIPKKVTERPVRELLAAHNSECDWL